MINFTRINKNLLALLLLLILIFIRLDTLLASPDSHNEDLVIDAPWRTVRDYLPVLFFTPDFKNKPYRKIKSFKLYNYDRNTKDKKVIFIDSRENADDRITCGITFIDPNGKTRSNLSKNEVVDSFWHYIARIPVACIGVGNRLGKSGVHFLYGEINWERQSSTLQQFLPRKTYKVLRVVVTPDGFAKFSAVDHQYDVHVHTIAEQTSWNGISNVNAPRKAFGGPLAMLVESAYALGMVNIQLKNANWSSYKDKIVTTDHNAFYSGNPSESGAEPSYGPTRNTDGEKEEFQWYRDNFGVLGGEEVTLKGANGKLLKPLDIDAELDSGTIISLNIGSKNHLALGSHLLSYGAPHFEGPWHGGKVIKSINGYLEGVGNDLSIAHTIAHMGSTNGFGYASHPESSSLGWSDDYYKKAIGLKPFNMENNSILQKNGHEFTFKGLQIWNEHSDKKSIESGNLEDSESLKINPFSIEKTDQKFVEKDNWRSSHDKTYLAYKRLLVKGLRYSFSNKKEHIFIRKLYMSAGTDAHGDFNYAMSIGATAYADIAASINFDANHLSATNNAFGRFRTYSLTSQNYIHAGASTPFNCPAFPFCDGDDDLTAPSYLSVNSYKQGNTVVTDGPIGRFFADANCRFNSDFNKLNWHDAACIWENHDGMIGGRGNFDGGNTLLAPSGYSDVYVDAQWIGKNDYVSDQDGKKGRMIFNFNNLGANNYYKNDNGIPFKASKRRSLHIKKLNDVIKKSFKFPVRSALILEGKLNQGANETRFITNPVWIAPYKITIDAPKKCPIKPGELTVTIEFPISMDPTLPIPSETSSSTNDSQITKMNKGMLPDLWPEINEANEAYDDTARYQGIRVIVKPLDSTGKSTATQFELSNRDSKWEPVEIQDELASSLIQDAKYTTTNTMRIACGNGWDSLSHTKKGKRASYAIVVDKIYDMHKNYLNPIGKAFVVEKKSSVINDPRPPSSPTAPTQLGSSNGGAAGVLDLTKSTIVTIQQKSTTRYLDAHEYNGKDYRLVTRKKQDNPTQKWRISPLGNNTFTLRQHSNGRHVDAHETSENDFSLVTRPSQNNNTQRWIINRTSAGLYRIQQKSNRRYMDAHESDNRDFEVVTRPYQNNNTQLWEIKPLH